MKPALLRHAMNVWPPFLASGIKVVRMDEDFRAIDVELRARPWNRNYVGTHFGGSLFAMADPFWMLMVMRNLGRDYTVWDRAASIDFLKPGKGTVRAEFRLDPARLDDIRAHTPHEGDRYRPDFSVDVTDKAGEIVARITKTLHIRRQADTRAHVGRKG